MKSKIDEVKCNKCKTIYPCYEGNFKKHKNGKDGYEHTCKKCRNELRKTPIARGKNNEYTRKWREENKSKDLQYQKERRENPIHKPIYKAATANTKAKKMGVEGRLHKQDIIQKLEQQKNKCFYCGTDIANNYEIDHKIPFSRKGANTKDNIVMCCKQCNRSKWIFDDIKRTTAKRNIQQIKEQRDDK